MRVVHVPQLQDNYGYLFIDEERNTAGIVDPAEAQPVLEAVAREGVKLTQILNTHHHYDHTGGNLDLLQALPSLEVIGSKSDAERIPGITRQVSAGDAINVGSMEGSVLFVPCHTSGHIAYRFGEVLFTGDTLFAAGCGRFFEGTAADMHKALNEVIASLPDDTLIYCGHEYTEANLKFAASVEPDNPDLQAMITKVADIRKRGEPSVPTRLGEEKKYNPFMRPHAPQIKESVKRAHPDTNVEDPVAVMAALREMKNAF